MPKTTRAWILAAALPLAVTAMAGGDPTQSPRRIAPPQRIPAPVARTVEPVGTPIATASIPREVRRAVVADAARRFEVSESAVVLSAAEQVTWSDGSLGCPQPGMSYTQALVPGFRLMASTSAGRMLYHTDSRGNVVTCASPTGARGTGIGTGTGTGIDTGTGTGTGSEPRTQPPEKTAPSR